MTNPTPTQHHRATEITNEIATLGFALPGSVALRYTTCGTPGCRCHADPPGHTAPTPAGPARSRARPSPGASAPSSTPNTNPGSKPTGAYGNSWANSKPSPWRSSRANYARQPARNEKHRPPSEASPLTTEARAGLVGRAGVILLTWQIR